VPVIQKHAGMLETSRPCLSHGSLISDAEASLPWILILHGELSAPRITAHNATRIHPCVSSRGITERWVYAQICLCAYCQTGLALAV
jgi:hypothetical protein